MERVDSGRGQACCPTGAFYAIQLEELKERGTFFPDRGCVGVMTTGPSTLDVDYPFQLELADRFLDRALASGREDRCEIIAEAGVNHNGDREIAFKLVDAAARAGAGFVKFQTFDPSRLVSRTAAKADYQVANTGTSESQHEMLSTLRLPREWHGELVEHCEEKGVGFLSTPFDEASADFLAEVGVPCLKIPSGEITNWPFLDHVGRLGLPIILSTGMSHLTEVADAVEVLERAGVSDLTILHCVSNYPTEPADVNLRALDTLRAFFGRRTGWSDHTLGIEFPVAAVARGAAVVEKHFTLDREMPGPDHRASLEPDELAEMVAAIRRIEAGLGSGVKEPRPSEFPVAAVARKSLHLTRDVSRGEPIRREDVEALRPGTGIPPTRLSMVLGKAAREDLEQGTLLTEDLLE